MLSVRFTDERRLALMRGAAARPGPARLLDVEPEPDRLQRAVVVDEGGEVGDVDRDVLGKIHPTLAATNHFPETLAGPAAFVGEQHIGEFERVLHPHAAMAEGPAVLGEEFPVRGVVHVDRVAVGEEEFQFAQRIARARLLDHADPGIGTGGCFIETELGNIDARLKTQLQLVLVELLKVGRLQ